MGRRIAFIASLLLSSCASTPNADRVNLGGRVRTLLERDQAVSAARLEAVGQVEDQIEVRPRLRSDFQVRRDVLTAIAEDPDADPFAMRIAVSGGKVILRGTTASDAESRIAARAARRVEGVREIENQSTVQDPESPPARPDAPKDDAQLRREVVDAIIGENDAESNRIKVRAQNGVVTLSGTVARLSERLAAQEAAAQIAQVKTVVNSIGINPPLIRPDPRLKQEVAAALSLDPYLGSSDITVSARRGVVRLSGLVASLSEKDSAERVASTVMGVVEIRNDLLTQSPAFQ